MKYSSGAQKKRMVPTRWAITGTDDIICKNLKSEIKDFNEIDSIEYYNFRNLHNEYHILLIPDSFQFEMHEKWKNQFGSDDEGHLGRKTYPKNVAGGYFAAQNPVLSTGLVVVVSRYAVVPNRWENAPSNDRPSPIGVPTNSGSARQSYP